MGEQQQLHQMARDLGLQGQDALNYIHQQQEILPEERRLIREEAQHQREEAQRQREAEDRGREDAAAA